VLLVLLDLLVQLDLAQQVLLGQLAMTEQQEHKVQLVQLG
jgi:hypothetical protein